MVLPDLQVPQVHLVHQDPQALQVLRVHSALLVHLVYPGVLLVWLVLLAPQVWRLLVLLDPQVHRVLQVRQDLLVLRVLLDPLVHLGVLGVLLVWWVW